MAVTEPNSEDRADEDDDDGTEVEIQIDRAIDDAESDGSRAPWRWRADDDADADGRDTGGFDRSGHSLDDVEEPAMHHLEDELGRIDLLTTPEGYVEGRVTDITSVDPTTVRLEVALPHDETVAFTLEKPIPWSEEFLLARIVDDVGYDASSIGHLVGEPVYVTRTDLEDDTDGADDWWSLSSFSAWVGLETESGPEWRLVDPLERPEPTDAGLSDDALAGIATALVLFGTLAAAAGAVFAATGGVVVSAAVLASVVPGLVLALCGLLVLLAGESR